MPQFAMPLRVKIAGTTQTPAIHQLIFLFGKKLVNDRIHKIKMLNISIYPLIMYNYYIWGYSSAGRALAWHARVSGSIPLISTIN